MLNQDYRTSEAISLAGLTLGRKIRLARIAKGLRQLDVASQTGLNPVDISNVELDRSIRRWKVHRILEAVGLTEGVDAIVQAQAIELSSK